MLFRLPAQVACALAVAGPLLAQGVETVDVEACRSSCGIAIELIATLGDEADGAIGEPASILQLESGDWVVTDHYYSDRIKVFDDEGDWKRTLGRKGKGPGEFHMASLIRGAVPGAFTVVDTNLQRETTYDGDYQVLDTKRLPARPWSIISLGADVYMSSMVVSKDRAGLPLHRVSEGELVHSFGASPPISNLRKPALSWRSLFWASDSSFWAAHASRYRIEEWDSAGRLLRVVQRTPEWFLPHDGFTFQGSRDNPPKPSIPSIQVDTRGLLWVILHVPDEDYESAFYSGTDPYGRVAERVGDFNKYADTLIEVIDPGRGRVVGTVRREEAMYASPTPGVLFSHGVSEVTSTVEVWKVRLSTSTGGR